MLPDIIQDIERRVTIDDVLRHYKARPATKGDAVQQGSVTRFFCPLSRCAGDNYPHFVVDGTRAVDQYGKPIDFSHHVNKDVVVRYHWRCDHTHTEGFGSVSLLSACMGMSADVAKLTRDEWKRLIISARDYTSVPGLELEDDARNGWLSVYAPTDSWSVHCSDGFTPEALRVLGIEGMDGIDSKAIVDTLHETFGLWQVEKYLTAGMTLAGTTKSYERRAHALFPIFAFCYNLDGTPVTTRPDKLSSSPSSSSSPSFPVPPVSSSSPAGQTSPTKDPTPSPAQVDGDASPSYPAIAPAPEPPIVVMRIVMPAFQRRPGEDFDWKRDFWTALNTPNPREVVTEWRHRNLLQGDRVAMQCTTLVEAEYDPEDKDTVINSDPLGRSAQTVLDHYGSPELLVDKKEVEIEEPVTDKKGNDTGKTKTVIKPVQMHPLELKLNRCVLCGSPLEGVAAYMWLNYPRLRIPSGFHANNYWHVLWQTQEGKQLDPFESNRLRRVAIDTFELFGNDRAEISLANTNALRYNYLRLCMLPTRLSELDAVDWGLGVSHVPHSPIDFFRYYVPTMDELARNMLLVGSSTGVKAIMLQRALNGSSEMRPFTVVPKKKKNPGDKAYSYELNMAACWQMMVNNGYCRSLLPNKKRDTIGQCYRIDGHFVYELDPASVMADMRSSLADYARDNGTSPEDIEMMMNAMLRCKDLQYEKNITKLPLMAMPKSESYGPELDHFFFRNGVLEITPSSIVFRNYSDVDFLVYASQVLPFDYRQPFWGKQDPIVFRQSEEYTQLLDKYNAMRADESADESALFDVRERLRDLSLVGQWDIDIQPADKQIDPRIVVPRTILDDTEHNQWLRWWPFLRLLRCFANEDFQEEEAGRFTDVDRRVLMARMANLMFTIGRCIFRYRGVQYMPYFLENTVNREGRAQGGSGKSVLVEHFLRFVRYVCNVNGKDMKDTGDFAKNFSNFVLHRDDVVHIEDYPKMAIDPLFNYASGTFRARSLFENPIEVPHAESPNIVITSNFMVQSTDESSLGRVQFGGMSHYFSREVAIMNKAGRKLDTIFPDIRVNAEAAEYPIELRSQIIYTLAKCLQFTMMCTKLNVQVAVPGSSLLERLSRTEMGDSFYDWITELLSHDYIYNAPIAINEIFNSYRSYLDPSKARVEMVSRTKFYENLQKYCAKPAHGVLFMPIKPFLSTSEVNRSKRKAEDGSEKSYIRKYSSWLTRSFIDEKGRVHHARVLSKNAGENAVTGGAVWFSQRGKEPKDADEFRQLVDAFLQAPDPEPILDADEQPITESVYSQWTMLNTEEEAEIIRKAGGIRRPMVTPTSTAISSSSTSPSTPIVGGEAIPDKDDLPF